MARVSRDVTKIRRDFESNDKELVDEEIVGFMSSFLFTGVAEVTAGATIQAHFRSGETAAPEDIVEALRKRHGLDALTLTRKLLALRKGPNESMEDFLTKASSYMSYMGDWPEEIKIGIILNGIPESTARMVTNARPTTVEDTIELVYRQAAIDKSERQRGGGKANKNGGSSGTQTAKTKDGKKCFKCGKTGHMAAECPESDVVCFKCGEKGHISPRCPKEIRRCSKLDENEGNQAVVVERNLAGKGGTLEAILDTGAEVSIAYGRAGQELMNKPGVQVQVCEKTINWGGIKKCNRLAIVTFDDGSKEEFLILDTPGPGEVLLSSAYIMRNAVAWDFGNRIVEWKSGQVSTVRTAEVNEGNLPDFVKEAEKVQFGELETEVEAEEFGNSDEEVDVELTKAEKKDLEGLIDEFSDVFVTEGLPRPSTLPPVHLKLRPGARPIAQPARRMSETQRQFFLEWCEQMLEAGLVKKSKSNYKFQPVLVDQGKPNEWRVCFDFRLLNRDLLVERTNFPVIAELVDEFRGAKIMSLLDLKKGYHQLKVT